MFTGHVPQQGTKIKFRIGVYDILQSHEPTAGKAVDMGAGLGQCLLGCLVYGECVSPPV